MNISELYVKTEYAQIFTNLLLNGVIKFHGLTPGIIGAVEWNFWLIDA